MNRFVAAALIAVSFYGAASAATSPACALLSDEEAATVMRGAATVADGGPEMSGVSGCGWMNTAEQTTLTVQMLTAPSFASARSTAQDHYDAVLDGMTQSGQAAETLSGIGDRAFIVVAPDGASAAITVLEGDTILLLNTVNLSRDESISAATAMAAKA